MMLGALSGADSYSLCNGQEVEGVDVEHEGGDLHLGAVVLAYETGLVSPGDRPS